MQALNRMLGELDDTLLQLTSDAVFRGDAPESLVRRLSDPADYHLGTFTHADGNPLPDGRQPPLRALASHSKGDPETGCVRVDGPAWSYLVTDLHTGEMVATSNGLSPFFSLSLGPGEGKLFRLEPWTIRLP